ncbi:hypothetical protein [Erythrobacter sp. BLCC-B19]|uniref:hypothetical protein n=1 Tax=Erythrobacter sp. BLCC-B19 TaxID=3025315 RepID=UPI00235FAA68|nr:hypothetical protein [Erythrobacter sp. BLCC-B19]WDA40072.1 hypothetical protein PS060_10905 [Erythrobacter sp. BLCC-B19]
MVAARLLFRALLSVSVAAAAPAANACITYRESGEADFLEADLIFVGDLTDYEIVTAKDGYVDYDLAILTYRVDAVLKGKAGETIRLWWPNSTFELPESMSLHRATLVGVDQGAAAEEPWTGWLHYPSRNAITGLPQVHQPGCSDASILPVAPEDVATVKRWIAAGKADGSALSYGGFGDLGELPARRTAQVSLLPIGGGAVGIGALILAINRRQRRRKADRPPAG